MRINNISAVFQKQFKDLVKSKHIFIQFLIYPIIAFVMVNTVKIEDMPGNFFVALFFTMFICMAPISAMASIISEDRENNMLRALIMSDVKAFEYLIGVGSCIWIASTLISISFAVIGKFSGKEFVYFLLAAVIGILPSMLIGAVIGVYSKNQMMATSISIPVMMVFAFLPMLSAFNTGIEKFSRVTYSQQINNIINNMQNLEITGENIGIILINIAICVIAFAIIYRKAEFIN